MIMAVLLYRRYGRDGKVVRARLLFVRELVVEYGVPYRIAWLYAGFSSRREMERCWEQVF